MRQMEPDLSQNMIFANVHDSKNLRAVFHSDRNNTNARVSSSWSCNTSVSMLSHSLYTETGPEEGLNVFQTTTEQHGSACVLWPPLTQQLTSSYNYLHLSCHNLFLLNVLRLIFPPFCPFYFWPVLFYIFRFQNLLHSQHPSFFYRDTVTTLFWVCHLISISLALISQDCWLKTIHALWQGFQSFFFTPAGLRGS